MSHHDSYYKNNEAYAEHLAAWDPALYSKYADTLMPDTSPKVGRAVPSTPDAADASSGAVRTPGPTMRVLDVGCGVGQVVARLNEAGFEAHGVDVSQPNIERARQVCPRCQLYDGRKLPFPDNHFASAG